MSVQLQCSPPNTYYAGSCYQPCPEGYEGVNDTECRQVCPDGYFSTDTSCIRPIVARKTSPPIQCPPGATRVYDICLLACPDQTDTNFETCTPKCPPGFTESLDKTSCLSELITRTAVIRDACYQGETKSGPFCLRPCPSGTAVYDLDPSMCYRLLPDDYKQYFVTYGSTSSKVSFQRSIVPSACPDGFTVQDGTCYATCPPQSSADHSLCYLNCPDGFPSLDKSVACLRPTIPRLTAVSKISVLTSYLRIGGIFVGIFILIGLLSFVTKALRRK